MSAIQLFFTYSDAVEKVVRQSMRGVTSLRSRVPESRDRAPIAAPVFPWSKQTVTCCPDTMLVEVHNLDKIETVGLQDFVLEGGATKHLKVTVQPEEKKEKFRPQRKSRVVNMPRMRRMSSIIPLNNSAAVLLARAGESDMADRALEDALEGLHIEDGELDEVLHRSPPVPLNLPGMPPPLVKQFTWEVPPSRCDTVLTPSRLPTPLQGNAVRKKKQAQLSGQVIELA